MPEFDSLVQKTDFFPGARVLRRNKAADTNPRPPVPPVPVPDVDYGIIRLTAKQGFTRNHAGDPITDYDLGTTNPNFSEILASLYPGGATDDNDIQWEVPIPQDMDLADPQISVILHFLAPEPPFTPPPSPFLPTGCTDAFVFYTTDWIAAKMTFDGSGNLISDGAGNPVMVPCP